MAAHLRRDEASWRHAAAGCGWELLTQFVLIPLAAVVVFACWWFVARGWPRWASLASMSGVGIILLAVYFWLEIPWTGGAQRTRARRATVIEAFLNEGLCASCGYEIKTTSPEADGCVVCPECGAAWRLALHGRATDPETRPWSGKTG
jgi:DNA-directed RNA polymerase subunit RPC12/RpoP